MEPDTSEGLPGPSSAGDAPADQFVSPYSQAAAASGIAARPLEQWSGSEREEAERKRAKTCAAASSSTDLHPNVELCPLQREVLNKVVSTLDTTNSSVVITNPQIKGARRALVARVWRSCLARRGNARRDGGGVRARLTAGGGTGG